MNKVKVDTIEIVRLEGPSAVCGIKHTFHSWEAANLWLIQQSPEPPQTYYGKHDFKVVFCDGEIYQGRLDCLPAACKDNDLDVKEHIRRVCVWHAGFEENPHCGKERYKELLRKEQEWNPGSADTYKRFLELYL